MILLIYFTFLSTATFFNYIFVLPFSPITSEGILLENTVNLCTRNGTVLCGEQINYLEHVEVYVNLTYSRPGDLLIKLVSPHGTVSNLTHYRRADSTLRTKGYLDLVLMTLHFWGENPVGTWKLTLENSKPRHKNTGNKTDTVR